MGSGGNVDIENEIINSKQLYQTFMKLVEGDAINFITHGQGNRANNQQAAFNRPTMGGAANGGNAGTANNGGDDDF